MASCRGIRGRAAWLAHVETDLLSHADSNRRGRSLVSPAVGVIACIAAYLLNPTAIQMENKRIRFELIITVVLNDLGPGAKPDMETWVIQNSFLSVQN